MVTLSGARSPRRALAAIGATVSTPIDGRPLPLSPVERGRMVETGDLELTGDPDSAGASVRDPAFLGLRSTPGEGAETVSGDLRKRRLTETGDRKA